MPRRNGARSDMLGNEGTNGAAEGDELLSAMAIGGQAIVPINLLSQMAQRYSSFSRDLAQPIPDQGLEVHWYWIGLSTNANAVFFSHRIGISLHGPSTQIAS